MSIATDGVRIGIKSVKKLRDAFAFMMLVSYFNRNYTAYNIFRDEFLWNAEELGRWEAILK